jgi:SAM-dependent methyltransferase
MTVLPLTTEQARRLAEDTTIVWHQRLQLAPDVSSPGRHDIESLLDLVGFPQHLDGKSVLDVGTCNGGSAFIAELRGASRVVGVDIYDPSWFGFDKLASALGSRVEFLKASIYELPALLREKFDYVLFLGVLYHLRHPLLAVDSLRSLTSGTLYVESAVCPDLEAAAHCNFYPGAYRGDSSNWFVPSERCLSDWFASSGFTVHRSASWPETTPERAMLVATPTERAFLAASYEVPLEVTTSISR